MLRARICSFCGADMPAGGRIDRRYCRASCRTLAYRRRRAGYSDRGSLLDVVQALESRLSATATELIAVRQRFATELGQDASQAARAKLQQAHTRDEALLRKALREQESLYQHLGELEGQRNALRGEVAELNQKVERMERAHQERVQELLNELGRQRMHYESLRILPASVSPSSVVRPAQNASAPPEGTPLASSLTKYPEPSARRESPVEKFPVKPPRASSPPTQPARAAPGPSKQQQGKTKPEPHRRVVNWPRIEGFAERTLRRRIPEYLQLQRPDLKREVRHELVDQEGSLHNIARLLSRQIFAGLLRGQVAGDVPRFAATCVDKLYRYLATDVAEQALCGPWPREERQTIEWLSYQLVVAMMGDFGRLSE